MPPLAPALRRRRRAPRAYPPRIRHPTAHVSAPPVPHRRAQIVGDWAKDTPSSVAANSLCSSGYFFDPAGLECNQCPTGSSVDGFGCACPANTRWVAGTGIAPYGECTACETNTVLSWDNSTCMACDASNGASLNAAKTECECLTNGADDLTKVLVEVDESGTRYAAGKRCVTCPSPDGTAAGARDVAQNGKCISCDRIRKKDGTGWIQMTYDTSTKTCSCPSGDDYDCFDLAAKKSSLTTAYPTVTFDSTANTLVYTDMGASIQSATVISDWFANNLIEQAHLCNNYGNTTACNAVANACVLAMYSSSHAACKLYAGMRDKRTASQYHQTDASTKVNPKLDWSETLPWLYYSTGDYASRTDVGLTMSFSVPAEDEYDVVSNLVFVLSVSTLSGEWLGFRPVGKLLQLCGGREDDLQAWARFGTNYFNDCSLPVADALDAARGMGISTAGETLFFDLYLQDLGGLAPTANAWPERLYPVPIKVSNIAENSNAALDDDTFVRRFFVIDETAGVASGTEKAVTYMKNIKFTITARSDEKSKIYPPTVSITYASRDPSFAYTVEDSVGFQCEYTVDDSFWTTWDNVFITAMVFSGAYWAYGMMRVSRRRITRDADSSLMMYAVGTGAACVAGGLAVVLIFGGLYWFLFFKAQQEVYTVVPMDSDSRVKMFKEVLDAAVGLAAVGMAYTIAWQCNYDIFFLDWEKPRATTTPQGHMMNAPVSTWRKMFIANEWNELQTERLTSRAFTLTLMLLFLLGLDWQNMCVIEPTLATDDPKPYQVQSMLLRFALAAILMCVIVLCQVVYKIVWHHNYVEHPILQFVDLLTMANMSIILLDDECSGYYLHGRSLMTFSDTSMQELMAQMRREEEMQVSARGLVPSAARAELAENQVFELYITKELRMAYESKLLRRIQEAAAMQGGGMMGAAGSLASRGGRPRGGGMAGSMGRNEYGRGGGGGWGGQGGGTGGGMMGGGGSTLASDQTLAAAEEIGDIFKQLINFTEANASSFVLERPFFDRILNMPPESVSMMQGASPVFYHDFQMNFQKVMFYGIELQLMIFDLLVFTALDKEFNSFAIAAFLTWLVGIFVDHFRQSFGETNISRKSLIDGRFLI